ncbi:MAG: hypothetical protein LBS69_00490 [Prevotellaceae bacterium]|jgi:hypothetical protein|nr:hypothetical protein [Prevotellaceae bacterium]
MELVKDKTLYHIQKEPFWKVGETHFVGLQKNYFLEFFDVNGHNFEDPVTKKTMVFPCMPNLHKKILPYRTHQEAVL